MPSPRSPRVSEDKIQDSRIRANSNVFRGKSTTLLSSFSFYNPSEHCRSSLGMFLFYFTCVFCQVGLCLSGLGKGSGL